MNEGRLRRIEDIFERVAALSPEKRGPALARECADDAPLRAEIESLLDHADAPRGFLESPLIVSEAVREALPDSAAALIGTLVGPYRLERRIASGGMGTVYLAVRADGEFKQRVAIKLVKRGMDSDEILRRFRDERQTLANLRHPNIASLIDGGAGPDGLPFLVMEYIEGIPIDEYCAQRGLDTAGRLRLFATVCKAVHFAHNNLVVHRDLKPAHILVTGDGVPKLLDFGIATVLNAAEGAAQATTLPAERRLTPEYASPEQVCNSPITTASDVYSLGVILYELLSGARPYYFHTRTTSELERIICRHMPPPPSQAIPEGAPAVNSGITGGLDGGVGEAVPARRPDRVRRRLRGELDTIVMVAMRKEPERRYASAEQLAADIERYLADQPLVAQRDTFTYRTSKFFRRHTLATVAAAALLLSVAVGVIGTAWQARRVSRQRDAAFVARDQAEAIAKFFQDMLASASPDNQAAELTVREVLDMAVPQVQAGLDDQPRVKAALLDTIGGTYTALGLYGPAEQYLREALEHRRRLLGEGHHDVAESKKTYAALLYATQRFAEAEQLLREALAVFRTIRGDENLDTARTLNDLGAVLRAEGKLDEAERSFLSSLDIRRSSEGPGTLGEAETLNNLASLKWARGDLDGAIAGQTESLAIRRRLLPAQHALVGQSLGNLAVLLATKGRFDEAEELYVAALANEEHSLGPLHPEHALTLANLAGLKVLRGDTDAAIPLLRQALVIRQGALRPDDPRTVRTRAALGHALVGRGVHYEAEGLLLAAAACVEKSNPPAPDRLAPIAADLATLYRATGRPEDAARWELVARAPRGNVPPVR